MSDNSGEISWTSDDNEGESFTNPALDSPLKIPRYIRRKKKQAHNLSNLNVSFIDSSAQNIPKSPVLGIATRKTNLAYPLKCTSKKGRIHVRNLPDFNDENDKSADPPSPIFKPNYSNKKPTISPRLKLSPTPLISIQKSNKLLFTTKQSPTTIIQETKHVSTPNQCNSVNMKNPSKSPVLCTNNRISSRSFRSKLNFLSNTNVTDKIKKSLVHEENIKSTETHTSSVSVVMCEEMKKVKTTPKIEKEQIETIAGVTDHDTDVKNVPKTIKSNRASDNTSNIEQLNCSDAFNKYADYIYKNTHNNANRKVISGKVIAESKVGESTNTTLERKHNIDKDNSDNKYSSPDIPKIYSNLAKNTEEPNKSSNKRLLPDLTSPPDERVMKKIKSYFESHFSSHSNTQVSICGSTPQSQKSNSESRILTPVDITESNSPLVSQETFKISSERCSSSDANAGSPKSVVIKSETDDAPKRRRRYRKNGLAGRLQSLLKKQKNQLFLWQHEIYLASNSNFVVPNSNPHRLFGIKRINPDYGCYLIEAVDVETEKECFILLNVSFDCNVTLSEKSFLKLFEPFQVMETPIGTVIVNACKFECVRVKEEKL